MFLNSQKCIYRELCFCDVFTKLYKYIQAVLIYPKRKYVVMDIQAVDLITYAIVGLSFWCFSIMSKTSHYIRAKLKKEHMYDTEDAISLVTSSLVFFACVFVLWVEPGLIKKLPSVFTAIVTGTVILLFYITDLFNCKHKHHHYIR